MTGADFTAAAVGLVEDYRVSVRKDFEAIPEARIWERPVPGQVSPANLVLHLTGNLRHFFGHLLGESDYRRDRDREFQEEPTAGREEILSGWERACAETCAVLRSLGDSDLDRPAPLEHYPGGVPVRGMVLRLLGHLAYHAGQIRTHYRMMAEP
jgi:hypothetical protein